MLRFLFLFLIAAGLSGYAFYAVNQEASSDPSKLTVEDLNEKLAAARCWKTREVRKTMTPDQESNDPEFDAAFFLDYELDRAIANTLKRNPVETYSTDWIPHKLATPHLAGEALGSLESAFRGTNYHYRHRILSAAVNRVEKGQCFYFVKDKIFKVREEWQGNNEEIQ